MLQPWIDERKQDIETLLKELVEINTYTANTAGVDRGMDTLSRVAQQMGFTVEAINGRHRLIRNAKAHGNKRVLLISHMDTVFPPDGDFLHYEVLEDGFVRGPGVGDIKGGLVMGLYAMLALKELYDDYDVQMIVSADEEKGSPTIRDWYMGGHVGANWAIGLEPGFPQGQLSATVPLGVVRQRRGYGAFLFKITGLASHSGTPHLGLNALEAAAQRIVRIHALNQWDKGISTNVGMLNGGISPNTVPGEVTGAVSFRYETLLDGENTRDAIEQILTATYLKNEEMGVVDQAEVTLDAFIPPMEHTPENQKLVDIVLQEAEKLGHHVVPIARGGGSDANFTSAAGTPSICGMGAPAHGIHTTEEMIHLPMMLNRINLLASTIYRLVSE
ncbi:MAG: M20 family metallopeptidase [Phototrophicales bacterium]